MSYVYSYIHIYIYIDILWCWLFNRIDIITTFVQSKSLVYVSTCKKLYKVTMKEGRKSKTFYIILISRVYLLFGIDRLSATWQLYHWNINAIFTKFSLLAASEVVKMTASDATRDENVINTLQWRYNGHDCVSNHQPHDCLLSHLFRRRSKKTSKLRVTGPCAGNSPGPVNSPHKGPVTRKMFPFDDDIILMLSAGLV